MTYASFKAGMCKISVFFCTRSVVGYRRKNGIFVRFGGEKKSFLCLGHRSVFLAARARLRVALLSVFSRCSLGGKSNLFAKKCLKSCICAVFGVSSTYSPLFSTGAPSKVQSRPAAHMQGMGVFASTVYSV